MATLERAPDPQEELEKAFEALAALGDPEPVHVTLADGGEVTVRPLKGREFAAFARATAALRDEAVKSGTQSDDHARAEDFLDTLARHADSVYAVVELSTSLDVAQVEALDVGDLCLLWGLSLKANQDFFSRSVLAGLARNRAALPGLGATPGGTNSSASSLAEASPAKR